MEPVPHAAVFRTRAAMVLAVAVFAISTNGGRALRWPFLPIIAAGPRNTLTVSVGVIAAIAGLLRGRRARRYQQRESHKRGRNSSQHGFTLCGADILTAPRQSLGYRPSRRPTFQSIATTVAVPGRCLG